MARLSQRHPSRGLSIKPLFYIEVVFFFSESPIYYCLQRLKEKERVRESENNRETKLMQSGVKGNRERKRGRE